MRPRKNNHYHSWETLSTFVKPGETKKVGPRATLANHQDDAITLRIDDKRVTALHFSPGGIILVPPAWRAKAEVESLANPILSGFGWYWGRIIYGPLAKNHYGLKPTNVTPGTVECDLNSVLASKQGGITLNWTGKPTKYQQKLSPSQIKKALVSHRSRSEAQKKVREFAYVLGFPNTAKMGGFKLPRKKDMSFAASLNTVARQMGFLHTAHAWACDVNIIPQDEDELEMFIGGVGKLVAEHLGGHDTNSKHEILFARNDKLWLRQRPMSEPEYKAF